MDDKELGAAPAIVLNGDRWNARARSRQELSATVGATVGAAYSGSARRCAGLPLHLSRNLKQLYHDGCGLQTFCSTAASFRNTKRTTALAVDTTLGHSRTRALTGALWSLAISDVVRRRTNGIGRAQSKGLPLAKEASFTLDKKRCAIDDSSGPCLTRPEAFSAHLDQRRQLENWEADVVEELVPAYRSARFGRRREP